VKAASPVDILKPEGTNMCKLSLKYFLSFTGAILMCMGLAAQEPSQEPISIIGHGAMFDQKGREVAPTLSFIQQALNWYRAELLKNLPADRQAEFSEVERSLTEGLTLDKQSRLVLNTFLLDWLLDHSQVKDRDRIRGKNNLMKSLLKVRLGENPDIQRPRSTEPFKVNPKLLERLTLLVKEGPEKHHFLPMLATGVQCQANGVPIPPDFGPSSAWVSRGLIPQSDLFIVAGMQAEVLTWTSSSPVGMCLALPRFDGTNTVQLDGIICMGQASSKVCFWDNTGDGTPGTGSNTSTGTGTFTFQRGTVMPFNQWGAAPFITAAAMSARHVMRARIHASSIPTQRHLEACQALACQLFPVTGTIRS